jgi:cytochrome P450
MTTPSGFDWDPREPSVLEDQRSAHDRMRESCPVAHSEFMGWSLFRHADVVRVLDDPATFSSASKHLALPNGIDPPRHGQFRAALAPHFNDAAMAAIETRCREIALELLAPIRAAGHAELMEAFATPYTVRTLCAFLGWPESMWVSLGGWTHGNQQAALSRDPAAGRALAALLSEHVRGNLDAHRQGGHGDVSDALLATSVAGSQLDDDEIVSILRNWIAGEGTVAGGISLLILRLAQDQQLQDQLRQEPGLISAAVEEILRVDDPLVANLRTTTREVEVGDRTIPAGEKVTLMWISANRDERAFERPYEVDLARGTDGSLVWGHGIHLCLGAPLARLEMRIALEELLSQTSNVAVGGEVRRSVYPSDGLASFDLTIS